MSAVVRLPARMRAIILEALNGQGAAVQRADRGDDDAQRCTWRRGTPTHLTTRCSSTGWQAGPSLSRRTRPGPTWSATHTARGVRFRRARIVSEPLADYIRFEYAITGEVNVSAGEDVRWLPRRRAPRISCRLATTSGSSTTGSSGSAYFAGDGAFLEDELSDDPAVARMCAEAFEAVWERAIPHADYRPA